MFICMVEANGMVCSPPKTPFLANQLENHVRAMVFLRQFPNDCDDDIDQAWKSCRGNKTRNNAGKIHDFCHLSSTNFLNVSRVKCDIMHIEEIAAKIGDFAIFFRN